MQDCSCRGSSRIYSGVSSDVLQGTLALLVLKTLAAMGPAQAGFSPAGGDGNVTSR